MGDLFDIANLITTVGVDRIKIKPEPGLPEKSSNEILTELFSTFDAEEEIVSSENTDQQVPNASVKIEKPIKSQVKKKKTKRKHKHKDKKHKKKSKRNSSESNSDLENIKKKRKHRKKTKRRHEDDSSKSSDSDEPKSKISKLDTCNNMKKKGYNKDNGLGKEDADGSESFEKLIIKKNPKLENMFTKEPDSPQLPPISKKIEDDPEEQLISKVLEKPKQGHQGKILIKDLKNSIVYNDTVREIENKEKEKAARMEDGELSDSSTDNRTPTLSPSPVRCTSFRSSTLSPTLEKVENRAPLSPVKGEVTARNDLRLILREKEKKRLGDVDKRSEGIEKSKLYMDNEYKEKAYNYNSKITINKDSKHTHNCHSQERRRSESRTRVSLRRSKSRERDKRRDKSRDRYNKSRSSDQRESLKCRERRRHRSRSDDRSRDKYVRGRSRSRERKERIEIDKKKLLEIARRNAINMIKQGTLPLVQQDKAIAAIQAGGKTVDELTDFCKSLSKSEALGELSSISSEEDGSESEKGFHHPFLLKGRPSSIIMNIKDAKQLPTKTFQEKTIESSNQLRLQFPVSSGQHHRKSENEWIPVAPKKPEMKKQFIPATVPTESFPITPSTTSIYPVQQSAVFSHSIATEPIDIGSIVSQRLAAMRKLRENPNDVCAQNEMYRAQNEMKTWAESKQMPGQFTGSTGAKVLSPAELTSGYQAWARKLGYLALVCIHLRVCYRHIATSEKKQLQRRDVKF
ncbi:protein Son-like isoform X2 [Bombus flavifrons]|uniref:protein Son-like isoform X2 n=1 Tax=Bombus flavifrons TaxID=103934 RepID=UPI003703EFD4